MYRILRATFLVLVTVGALAAVFGFIGMAAWVRLAGTSAQSAATPTTMVSQAQSTPAGVATPAVAGGPTSAAALRQSDDILGPALISLDAENARLHGKSLRKDEITHDLTSWTHPDDWVDWSIPTLAGPSHNYFAELTYSSKSEQPLPFNIVVGDRKVSGLAEPTGSSLQFKTVRVGPIAIAGGDDVVSMHRGADSNTRFIRVRHLDLIPVGLAAGARGIVLKAEEARLHGDGIGLEQNVPRDIAYWARPDAYVEWTAQPARAGRYLVVLTYAVDDGAAGCDFDVLAGDQKISSRVAATGGWQLYHSMGIGSFNLSTDAVTVAVKPVKMPDGKSLMNLRRLELLPLE